LDVVVDIYTNEGLALEVREDVIVCPSVSRITGKSKKLVARSLIMTVKAVGKGVLKVGASLTTMTS
jgi:hypothetical protein